MLNLTFLLLLQVPSLEESVAAYANGDEKARNEVVKAGLSAILPLRKMRAQAPERIDALIYELKTHADGIPEKALLDAMDGKQAMECGEAGFAVAFDELSRGVSLLFDPALFRTHWDKSVKLDAKERPRRETLDSFCRQLGLDYGFFYGSVLIAEPARLWPAPAPVVRATPLTADETARAAKLIERLGAEEFQAREEAQAELKKMGKATIPLLEKGALGDDAERRARCTALVKALTEPPATATFHRPAAARQKLAGPDDKLRTQLGSEMVSFKVADIVLDGAMRLMLQPREIPVQLAPAATGVRLTLDLQNQTAWAIISLATHTVGFDFMIEKGKLVIDTREEIERRVAAGR